VWTMEVVSCAFDLGLEGKLSLEAVEMEVVVEVKHALLLVLPLCF
jgi:hypothetical protein